MWGFGKTCCSQCLPQWFCNMITMELIFAWSINIYLRRNLGLSSSLHCISRVKAWHNQSKVFRAVIWRWSAEVCAWDIYFQCFKKLLPHYSLQLRFAWGESAVSGKLCPWSKGLLFVSSCYWHPLCTGESPGGCQAERSLIASYNETKVCLSPLPSRWDVRTAAHRGLLQPPRTPRCDEASRLW